MRFIADENVSPLVAAALRLDGHDVIEASTVCPGVPDTTIATIAISERRIVLTEDKDFGALAFGQGIFPPGLVRLAMHGFDPRAKASRLRIVVAGGSIADGLSVVVEPTQVRRRLLPTSSSGDPAP